MSEVLELKKIGKAVRESRVARGLRTLDEFADKVAELAPNRPSVAKLSRIETGEQPVPEDILPAVATITEIPLSELRPDLAERAKLFQGGAT